MTAVARHLRVSCNRDLRLLTRDTAVIDTENIVYRIVHGLFGWIPLLAGMVWEFIREFLAWRIGWLVFRILSFGRYPREAWDESEFAEDLDAFIVCTAGLLVLGLLGWRIHTRHFW